MDLLAHSGSANLAARYGEHHPQRVGRLALITPSVMAVGITITGDLRCETARLRRNEPWFEAVFAAFGGPGAFAPEATRAALARFGSPVLLLAGEVDPAAPAGALAEFTSLFPTAGLVVQPEAGHFPWLDDADRFVSTTAAFLK